LLSPPKILKCYLRVSGQRALLKLARALKSTLWLCRSNHKNIVSQIVIFNYLVCVIIQGYNNALRGHREISILCSSLASSCDSKFHSIRRNILHMDQQNGFFQRRRAAFSSRVSNLPSLLPKRESHNRRRYSKLGQHKLRFKY
jgi:hypothetical protein